MGTVAPFASGNVRPLPVHEIAETAWNKQAIECFTYYSKLTTTMVEHGARKSWFMQSLPSKAAKTDA